MVHGLKSWEIVLIWRIWCLIPKKHYHWIEKLVHNTKESKCEWCWIDVENNAKILDWEIWCVIPVSTWVELSGSECLEGWEDSTADRLFVVDATVKWIRMDAIAWPPGDRSCPKTFVDVIDGSVWSCCGVFDVTIGVKCSISELLRCQAVDVRLVVEDGADNHCADMVLGM